MKDDSPESDSIAMLDSEECERARVRRDRRYDGRFFSGVRTTRIYCRPVCPVRPAQAKNVTFYPTAAAEAAGFRPCLRCRPETAPFSPAWQGSRTTVHRAMGLIRGGAFDRAGVEDLASRLGVGARHLDRLFQRHVGASPLQVARTMRVQRAKRLLDQTRLPMSGVACARASPACVASMPCSPKSTSVRQVTSDASTSSRHDANEKSPACAGPSP